MNLRRKTVWLIITAIPTLLLAAFAVFILHRFLAVRDMLGFWNVTMVDGHGKVLGHGEMNLVAEDWTIGWASFPFVTFTPRLAFPSGHLIMEDSAKSQYGDHMEITRSYVNSSQGINCWLSRRPLEISFDLHRQSPDSWASDKRRELTGTVWADE